MSHCTNRQSKSSSDPNQFLRFRPIVHGSSRLTPGSRARVVLDDTPCRNPHFSKDLPLPAWTEDSATATFVPFGRIRGWTLVSSYAQATYARVLAWTALSGTCPPAAICASFSKPFVGFAMNRPLQTGQITAVPCTACTVATCTHRICHTIPTRQRGRLFSRRTHRHSHAYE